MLLHALCIRHPLQRSRIRISGHREWLHRKAKKFHLTNSNSTRHSNRLTMVYSKVQGWISFLQAANSANLVPSRIVSRSVVPAKRITILTRGKKPRCQRNLTMQSPRKSSRKSTRGPRRSRIFRLTLSSSDFNLIANDFISLLLRRSLENINFNY